MRQGICQVKMTLIIFYRALNQLLNGSGSLWYWRRQIRRPTEGIGDSVGKEDTVGTSIGLGVGAIVAVGVSVAVRVTAGILVEAEAGSAVVVETENCFEVQALIPIIRTTKSTFCLFIAFINPFAAAQLLSTPTCGEFVPADLLPLYPQENRF
jgi:hypothetical protein